MYIVQRGVNFLKIMPEGFSQLVTKLVLNKLNNRGRGSSIHQKSKVVIPCLGNQGVSRLKSMMVLVPPIRRHSYVDTHTCYRFYTYDHTIISTSHLVRMNNLRHQPDGVYILLGSIKEVVLKIECLDATIRITNINKTMFGNRAMYKHTHTRY